MSGPESRTVTANGRTVELQEPCTLEGFLAGLGLPPRSVVVEQNGEAVAPSAFSERQVQPGDRLEIVRIVAGG
jgi:sulfur carrier protein